jgi:hypothetical protein
MDGLIWKIGGTGPKEEERRNDADNDTVKESGHSVGRMEEGGMPIGREMVE